MVRWLLNLTLLLLAGNSLAECPIDRPIQVGLREVDTRLDESANGGSDLYLIDELARRTGCRFALSYDLRVRIWKQIEEGRLDMTTSVYETPEREPLVRFVIVSWDRSLLLGHVKPGFPPSAEAFLADRRQLVGTVNTYRYSPGVDTWINQLRAEHRSYEAPDLATLLKVFDAGRVAVIPISSESYALVGKRYALSQPAQRLDWFANGPKAASGLALSRARLPAAVTDRFAEEVAKMRDDGTLLRIKEKLMSPELAREVLSSG
jgi:polar amino acid transport system substrate-binding protein